MRMHSFISSFKHTLCCIAKIGIVLVLVVPVLLAVTNRTSYHDNMLYFYGIQPNTIDVANIGSSHVHYGVNTVEMYEQEGICAYNLSAGSQSIWNSYFYIKELLKYHSPKVILVDVYTIGADDEKFNSKIQMNLQSMRPSWNKYQALKANNQGKDMFWSVWFNLPLNHDRYSELTLEDYEVEPEWGHMGFKYSNDVVPLEADQVHDVTGVSEIRRITPKAEEYLRKTIELCQQEGIGIVLMNAPFYKVSEDDQMAYNYVQKIADEYNIDFLNGALLFEELGLDWSQDNEDSGGHLNYSGSLKWTHYLMDYLKTNYDLPDHRPEKVEDWEKASELLHLRLANHDLRHIESAEDVFLYLALDNSLAFATTFQMQSEPTAQFKELCRMFGLEPEVDQAGYIVREPDGVVHSGYVTAEREEVPIGKGIVTLQKKKEILDSETESEGIEMTFNAQVLREPEDSGMTFMVYIPYSNEIRWSGNFDLP